jgi:hypothetical protein
MIESLENRNLLAGLAPSSKCFIIEGAIGVLSGIDGSGKCFIIGGIAGAGFASLGGFFGVALIPYVPCIVYQRNS